MYETKTLNLRLQNYQHKSTNNRINHHIKPKTAFCNHQLNTTVNTHKKMHETFGLFFVCEYSFFGLVGKNTCRVVELIDQKKIQFFLILYYNLPNLPSKTQIDTLIVLENKWITAIPNWNIWLFFKVINTWTIE